MPYFVVGSGHFRRIWETVPHSAAIANIGLALLTASSLKDSSPVHSDLPHTHRKGGGTGKAHLKKGGGEPS